ncbi:MAG: ABC transporter ATP-binding protein [Clostridia bacterium]|nr:ABC transporter ATP-binding protein [Clostridia bacterium]
MSEFMLETQNLGISFGGLKAAQDVNLKIKPKELYGLIGPNGAGKTTVFNMLTGVYLPTTGRFFLDGEDLTGKSTVEISRHGISRTFQNIRLFTNLSVIDNVLVGMTNRLPCNMFESMFRLPRHFRTEKELRAAARELLNVFGLDEERRSLASNLPYGKQRKLEIARALATQPKLLLLDEPAAGMNPHETAELTETIRFVRDHFDMTVLLIEHDMSLVSGLCDRVTVLNFGTTLAQGETSEVLHNPEVVRAYLGD